MSWRENVDFETDDCVTLFFIRKCLSVSFTFEYRAKVVDVDLANKSYVVQVVRVDRIDPSRVSAKYIQMKDAALSQKRQETGGIKTVIYTAVK